ncbi:uncharacterized protein UV8b_02070 [Ustilaginoidea virens]|uniref:Exonuclease domain-containing protein n=1 Tax=Ustilaginoidea virens TaxID=1159556 RepID=A0A8E5HLY6_USTVR|nr:uncharacterized protein UV8b_02070 [Ustilaginoidea virens]QUC17829.1 hypothetical protein UV8b_02070 [Ustilaginoidea virens]
MPDPDHTVAEFEDGTSTSAVTDDPLVWIDCEMTGLNPDTEEILEIYCLLTTGNLEVIDAQGFHAVIHHPASRLSQMGEWCSQTHGNSGLTSAVLSSSTTPEQAAQGLYNYITKHIPEKRRALLAGNSVHADMAFLRKKPYAKVVEHLHYRILDVSAIKEAGRRWCSRQVMAQAPKKKTRHLARDDILESIEEARYYRNAIFRRPS